tara:strand:- start:206 stop:646 length:441 start_codon:yes stop_codon:yes gene_type:complete
MKSNRISFILISAFFFNVGGLFGNYAFKKKVKDVCKSYRISMNSSQLELEDDEVSINMESGRNNFEMFMLVGFASAGQAIAHQKQMGLSNAYLPGTVRVIVEVPASKGNFNQFVAVCSSKMAISLADGGMDSSDFMQEVMKNMQIL